MRAKLSILLFWCVVVLTTAAPGFAQSLYTNADLDTLVGPIALYPDPVLTNVVKAATFPDQVVAASKTNVDDDSWDDSVKALDDYPDVLTMMAGNVGWTKSLGWAATNQLADTMDAVQRFRYRAQQAGNLSSNDKTQVIQEGTTIRIEPASPQVIYVPTYDPDDVDDASFGNAFVYGTAIAASAYLWTNVYHWNDNLFYAHPYGYAPGAGYYRPYGWQNGGVYGGNPVRLAGGNNNLVRGPVTVNNVNVNRNSYNNRTNIQGGNNINRVQAESRTTVGVGRPNVPSQMPAANRDWNRSSTPGLGSYGASGATMRESNRGAMSRQSTSFSSGVRMGGGGRGGRR